MLAWPLDVLSDLKMSFALTVTAILAGYIMGLLVPVSYLSVGRKNRKMKSIVCLLLLAVCALLFLWNILKHDIESVSTGNVVKVVHGSHQTTENNTEERLELAPPLRIFCLISTMERYWMTKRLAVQLTWAQRCDNYCFFYTPANNHTIHNDTHACAVKTPDSRGNLSQKVFESLNFIRNSFNGSYDWVLKADDDTYVIMENLRAFLSKYDSKRPHFFGHILSNALYVVSRGHCSGGGGYVLSSNALDTLLTNNTCKFIRNGYNEDLNVARCLSLRHIYPENTKDEKGLNRFHSEDLIEMLLAKMKDRTYNYRKGNYTVTKGEHPILSTSAITFHHMSHKVMYAYDYLIYDLKRKTHG